MYKKTARRKRSQEKKCKSGKVPYNSYKAAEFFGSTIAQYPYKCEWCGEYHLTCRIQRPRVPTCANKTAVPS